MKPTLISIAFIIALNSCQVVGSAITGQPIVATAVQRAGHDDATPIMISSVDLALAEQAARDATTLGNPLPINGLYDAGHLAQRAREVAVEAGK